ncbi:MAG: serine/threonine protein kinase [Clostridia bacterium]|nr:serine/threonine protein kinase [Clostridia bacterium]
MFDVSNLTDIKTIKKTKRQEIILTADPCGKKYIKRYIDGDKREIYKTLMKTDCANIPKIYYAGLEEKTVVVEEYIEGSPLEDAVKNHSYTKKQLKKIALQILNAMDSLHKVNIIHRDIKPDNILIDENCNVWLTDYDIARILRNEVRQDTEAMGTFGYAPIEQFGMLPTDEKTDIYSFGATLAHLLDNSVPYNKLRKIADKCKRIDPAERFDSAISIIKEIKKKNLLIPSIAMIIAIAVIVCANLPRSTPVLQETIVTPVPEETVTAEPPTENTDAEPTAEKEETPPPAEKDDFKGTFGEFEFGALETEYRKFRNFSDVHIFTFDEPHEHIFILEDTTKSGRIRFGENAAVADARFTLDNGTLSLHLDDGKGHTFSHSFYMEDIRHTDSDGFIWRRNADIICYDMDDDGADELFIGMNSGFIGTDNGFYNIFENCRAWCIRYDEARGFTLCDGVAVSNTGNFHTFQRVSRLNISWNEIGEITGYDLEGDALIPGI